MTTYKNSYVLPTTSNPKNVHLDTAPEDYDFNYMFEVKPLRSDRVELRPFVPKLHAQPLLDGVMANPELMDYIGIAKPWTTLDDVCQWQESVGRANPALLRYAIYTAPLDRLDAPVDEYVFAGTASLLEGNYEHMLNEVGWIIVLKPFQRTHVTTHMVGLTMHRMLDAPEDGGLGLRRCQWKANSLNKPSHNTAVRMGFKPEGVLRCLVALPPGNEHGIREGRKGVRQADRPVRDTWMASVTWYEWENGVREHVDKLMARRK